MFKKLKKKIDGYKVYILGVIGVLGVVVSWLNGAMNSWEAVQAIWVILLGMAGRSALGKTGTPA